MTQRPTPIEQRAESEDAARTEQAMAKAAHVMRRTVALERLSNSLATGPADSRRAMQKDSNK